MQKQGIGLGKGGEGVIGQYTDGVTSLLLICKTYGRRHSMGLFEAGVGKMSSACLSSNDESS